MSIFTQTKSRVYLNNQLKEIRKSSTALNLTQFYIDAASMGAVVDKVLFEAELLALPTVVKEEATFILVPGVYKEGMIYGLNPDTGTVEEFAFSRSSAATYIDKNGQMRTAQVNMPRLDYDPVTKNCNGYLLEGASTNYVLYSNEVTGWNNNVPIKTPNAGTTSTGKPMFKVEKGSTLNSEFISKACTVSTVGTTYSFRITIKAGSSPLCSIGIGLTADATGGVWGPDADTSGRIISGVGFISRGGGSLYNLSGLSTTTDTVVEVSRKYTNANITVSVYVYPGSSNSTTIGDSVLLSCAQLEALPTCTSYIETSGSAVTRTADNLSSVGDLVPYPETTVYMNFFALRNKTLSAIANYLIRTGSGRFWYATSTFEFVMSDGTNQNSMNYNIVDPISAKVITSFGLEGMKAVVNNNPILKKSYVGAFGSGPLVFCNGIAVLKQYVKAMAVIPRQLTDSEHSSATL